MDPSEAANIAQYIKLFGHAPPQATPGNLALAKALNARKQVTPTAPPAPVTPPPAPRGIPGVDAAVANAGG